MIENKEKLISLFKYIKELYAQKYQVITDIKRQEWYKFLEDIPNDENNITLNYVDRTEENAEEDSSNGVCILRVSKPEFTSCLKPPVSLVEWLKPGWDRYTNTAEYKDFIEVIKNNERKEIEFNENIKRVNDFAEWNKVREFWVKNQIKINETRKFFNELYNNYINLERDSETIEFMVGQGIMSEQSTINGVYHPVLLKRLRIEFDSEKNVISVLDTNMESEIYTMLLQGIGYINHSAIKKLKEQLSQEYYHPLDRNDTPDFLKSFIHLLHQDSKFIENKDEEISIDDKIIMYSKPVLFIRKRISGVVKAIEEIIEQIDKDGIISGPLLNIIGDNATSLDVSFQTTDISENLGALSGEDKDILLSKEANREQLEIAKRIEMYNAVLVQGPPGTGKTHTIANLMGHFLAQGKNVLVTSHTKKALTVVKDKVPKTLQDLCVSVLEDNNKDMARSVDGITEFISSHSSSELLEKSEKLKKYRFEILNQLSEIRKKLFAIKHKEYEVIVLNGNSYSIAEAAKFVYDHATEFSFIPGKVSLYKPMPITLGELELLYKTNEHITVNEEMELSNQLPNPNTILSPSEFEEIVTTLSKLASEVGILKDEIMRTIKIDLENEQIFLDGVTLWSKGTIEKLEDFQNFITKNESFDEWALYAVIDGKKGGGYKSVWERLIKNIQDTVEFADSIVEKKIGKRVTISNSLPQEILIKTISEIKNHLASGKKISKIDLFFHKLWNNVMASVFINENKINSVNDCEIVLAIITLNQKRSEIAVLWDELIAKRGGTQFSEFGDDPEQICIKRISKISEYINWYDDIYSEIKAKALEANFNINKLFEDIEFNSEVDELKHIALMITKTIPKYIRLIKATCFEIKTLQLRINESKKILVEGKLLNSAICKNLAFAIDERNLNKYDEYFKVLNDFYTKYYYLNERIRILEALKNYASDWASHIKNRIGIHGENKMPENVENAWLWKQFAGIIDEITSEPFESLQHKLVALNAELKTKTTELTENLSWYHLLKRVEGDIEKKQALQGWKLTQKKIGKGTGKHAPQLKREAQRLMTKCQSAVPAWIMPINKALESLDPTKNKFDIVIIDEASQSDISALAIMYLAKKIIIVGDDEQVSPSSVGIDIDKMVALSSMYIKDVIPNWHLYDMKSSLYDIAKTTYPILMLKEHFRCVPEIIGYSNRLAYDYKIKPLRDGSNSVLKPPTISYRVDGVRKSSSKVNEIEANTIIALILSCMEQPEYVNMTFGVISLLGDEQAKKINELALEKIDPKEYAKRSILCGNASQFQGDERDVIFISLVDSNEGEGPLRTTGEGVEKSTKQRYNVAVSRAKNQLWIVHSLDISKDLKDKDMRRDLIEYVKSPNSVLEKISQVNSRAESPFEISVGRDLVSRGYHIVPQWNVGSFRIDMVAVSGDKKVAIECDGELYHSGYDKVLEDMERQTILERLGWRFIRIRGSEYYRNPKVTIERVISKLDEYGISTETLYDDAIAVTEHSELLERVKIGAARILDEWEKKDE